MTNDTRPDSLPLSDSSMSLDEMLTAFNEPDEDGLLPYDLSLLDAARPEDRARLKAERIGMRRRHPELSRWGR
jgi:hypothetical protein